MFHSGARIVVCLTACGALAGCLEHEAAPEAASARAQARASAGPGGGALVVRRERIAGDLYHHEIILQVGTQPNARLRIHRVVRERAPWLPRPTAPAAMLLHGDFSTFVTNFAPGLGDPASPARGLAPYLAAQGFDVWGVDRRWTLPAAAGDVSDFGEHGVAQEIDDVRAALGVARAMRLATGGGGERLALIGFSHGAQLAYAYAANEGGRPSAQRHVDALVPLDYYAALPPEQSELREVLCGSSQAAYAMVADGIVDAPNDFMIDLGRLAREAPEAPSEIFPGMTQREAMIGMVGQTYFFVPYAPFYHLAAPILDGDFAVGLAESSEAAVSAWLAGATPHQALREAADFDALLCGEAPLPVDAPLAQIRIPVRYVGAAGGIGSLGTYTTTLLGSTEVSTQVVQRFGPDRRAEDFGHADLLFADDAPALAWQPLASWLLAH